MFARVERLLANELLRRVVHGSPVVHRAARRLSPLIYTDDAWGWHKIRGGPARGCWIAARPRTHKFVVSGTYEPAVVSYVVQHLRAGTLWDIGAHTGYVSLIALRAGGTAVAIEANPLNAERIHGALERNGFTASVVQTAVGEREGRARLSVAGDSSTGRIADEGCAVPMSTLDALRRTLPAPTIVKIDVEGYEAQVLAGGRRVLDGDEPIVIVELHAWADERPVYEHLARFDVTRLDDRHIVAAPV